MYLNILSSGGRRGADPLQRMEGLAGAVGAIDLRGGFVALGVLTATVLVFGRIAATSISREGKAWWLLKAAPLSGTELLGGKLLAAAVPFALLSSLLMLGAALWLGFGPLEALYGWAGVELTGVGMLALSAGLGVPWARLDWDDPRRMSSGWGGLVSAGASFLYALLSGALLGLPLLVTAVAPGYAPAAWALGLGGAVALTVGTVALALQFGSARLGTVGEP